MGSAVLPADPEDECLWCVDEFSVAFSNQEFWEREEAAGPPLHRCPAAGEGCPGGNRGSSGLSVCVRPQLCSSTGREEGLWGQWGDRTPPGRKLRPADVAQHSRRQPTAQDAGGASRRSRHLIGPGRWQVRGVVSREDRVGTPPGGLGSGTHSAVWPRLSGRKNRAGVLERGTESPCQILSPTASET